MAENKARTKMRKNRVTIDDKYMGPEPVFQTGETLKAENRRVLWGLGAQWYNYFYKSKDYVLRFYHLLLSNIIIPRTDIML